MCRWGALQLTSRLCRPQPGQDPWCWARWGGLGCRAGSVWLWWPGASPSPRPAAIDTPFRRGTRSGGREAARICILAGWSGSRLWRSSVICTDHLPRESKEDIVRQRRDVWLETHAQRVFCSHLNLRLSCRVWHTPRSSGSVFRQCFWTALRRSPAEKRGRML